MKEPYQVISHFPVFSLPQTNGIKLKANQSYKTQEECLQEILQSLFGFMKTTQCVLGYVVQWSIIIVLFMVVVKLLFLAYDFSIIHCHFCGQNRLSMVSKHAFTTTITSNNNIILISLVIKSNPNNLFCKISDISSYEIKSY